MNLTIERPIVRLSDSLAHWVSGLNSLLQDYLTPDSLETSLSLTFCLNLTATAYLESDLPWVRTYRF